MGTVGLSLLPAGSRRNRVRERGEERKLKRGSFFPLLWYVQSHIENAQIKMGQESMVKI